MAGTIHNLGPNPTNPGKVTFSVTKKRRLLQQSDVTYLGAFKIDSTNVAERPVGVAVRWVSGVKQLMVIDRTGWKLVELSVPALVGTSSDWPNGTGLNAATLIKRWTTAPFAAAPLNALNTVDELWGISWDETDKRLYWIVANTYSTDVDPTATLGWCVINDAGNTLTAGNRVSLGSPTVPQKQIQGGLLQIPSSFANGYLSGKRLGIGFGGYRSVIAQGSAGSIGPALYAINPPAASPSDGDAATGGPCLMKSELAEARQPRPAWAGSCTNSFEVSSDPTKWDWNMQGQASMTWVDTGTRYGVLYFASFDGCQMAATIASGTLSSVTVTNSAHIIDVAPGDEIKIETGAGGNGNDRTPTVLSVVGATINFVSAIDQLPKVGGACTAGGQYVNSALNYSRWQDAGVLVYDPADLAAVAAGSKQPYDVVPAASWSMRPPDLTFPLHGNVFATGITGGPAMPSVCYDPVESRLYVYWLSGNYKAGTLGAYPLVFVYQVG